MSGVVIAIATPLLAATSFLAGVGLAALLDSRR